MSLRFPLLLACLLLLPIAAFAHKIHVFAWVSGDSVTVESGFSNKRPLINGHVTVKDAKSDTIFLEGTGDREGIFTFRVPDKARELGADLLIVVAGSEGHQSEWLLPAAEYQGAKESIPAVVPAGKTKKETVTGVSVTVEESNDELKKMLQELLAQELAPIKRSLAENRQDKPGFRDIMGGIGYLLGLAGLVAWFRSRPGQEEKKQ
ncbi:MAG: hypothetical protein ABFR63_11715 [Thermodesulfobacteriota bacterium]